MFIVRMRLILVLAWLTALAAYPGSSSSIATPQAKTKPQSTIASSASSPKDASQSSATLELPINFERHLGDLDGMAKRRQIRILVIPSRSGFFYDKGHPQGIYYEAFDEFQRFVNAKYKSGSLKINIT